MHVVTITQEISRILSTSEFTVAAFTGNAELGLQEWTNQMALNATLKPLRYVTDLLL
jgi:hypothetical protein